MLSGCGGGGGRSYGAANVSFEPRSFGAVALVRHAAAGWAAFVALRKQFATQPLAGLSDSTAPLAQEMLPAPPTTSPLALANTTRVSLPAGGSYIFSVHGVQVEGAGGAPPRQYHRARQTTTPSQPYTRTQSPPLSPGEHPTPQESRSADLVRVAQNRFWKTVFPGLGGPDARSQPDVQFPWCVPPQRPEWTQLPTMPCLSRQSA